MTLALLPQLQSFTAARQALDDTLLSARNYPANEVICLTLLSKLGSLKWRRCLDDGPDAAIIQMVGEATPAGADPLEWLTTALLRFLSLVTNKQDDHFRSEVEIVADHIRMSGLMDSEADSELNIPTAAVVKCFKAKPLYYFLYCLYHSDVRESFKVKS